MSNEPSSDESVRVEAEGRVGLTLCQRYTLEKLIGIGGLAAVYSGAHRNGNRVAIKVLHRELGVSKDMRERFLREGYVANRVEHPGAVRVLDDDTTEDGTVFLVMELLEGETLEAKMVRQGGMLPPAELVPLIGQLLDVLAAAHEKGIVHRDIKPDNLFITKDRTLKVLDFGIARLADASRLATRTGRVVGTAVMAPEQARGEASLVDGQTDIWAAGAVMFRALSGHVVYEAATPEMVMVAAATQPARPLRTLVPTSDADIAEIVNRALAWKKEERWKTAQAMANALRGSRTDGASVPAPAPRLPSAPPMTPPMMPIAAIPAVAPNTAYQPPMVQALAPSQPPPQTPPQQMPSQQGQTQMGSQPPPQVQQQMQQQPPPMQPQAPPFGANPYMPQMPMPESTDNGWVKWVAAAAALVVLFVAGGGVLAFLLIRASSHSKPTATSAKSDAVWSDEESPVPVSSKDPVWGRRDAPVTIVVFSDFQCPFCSRVEPTLDQVKTTYGPEKVRIVWKNQPLPFHPNAKPAAEAAQIVFAKKGSDAFFTFHDLAFKNQAQLSPAKYEEWSAIAGVEGKEFKTAVLANEGAKKVEEDQALAKKIGANGTPSFRINGIELSGAQPFDKFKSLIDSELSKATAKIASGTPKDKVYVALSTEAFKDPPAAKKADEPAEDTTTVFRVLVGDSPIRGNVDAPVTIVEFGDFQCPFCKRAEQSIDKVRDSYGDKVRLVWKNEPLPFHQRAEPAAELALEARAQKGDLAFWRAHDKLFDLQPKLEDSDLEKLGFDLGLDAGKVRSAIRDKKHKKQIDADAELGDDVQASGTPHFFVNGRRLVGAQPFEKFKTIIDDELRKFDARQSGVAAKDYYASIMRDAKGPAEIEKKQAPPVPATAPFRGAKNAPVVIQEWADFQCPFCARAESTLTEVLKAYPTQVKIVWRDKPLSFHTDAPMAAEAAREAFSEGGPEAFFKMHRKLFDNQARLKRDDLDGYAKDIGLDSVRFGRALDGQKHKQLIDTDDKVGTDLGISGTPAFLINNYYLSGAQPFAKFKKLIDRAILDAR